VNQGSQRIDPNSVSMKMPAWPTEVARTTTTVVGAQPVRRVDQATGGSVYCWPARETCSVQALPSQ
jgi:hypothetical protein